MYYSVKRFSFVQQEFEIKPSVAKIDAWIDFLGEYVQYLRHIHIGIMCTTQETHGLSRFLGDIDADIVRDGEIELSYFAQSNRGWPLNVEYAGPGICLCLLQERAEASTQESNTGKRLLDFACACLLEMVGTKIKTRCETCHLRTLVFPDTPNGQNGYPLGSLM